MKNSRSENTLIAVKIIAMALAVVAVTFVALTLYSDALSGTEVAEAVVIKKGMTGSIVTKIQTKLKNWGYYTGEIDGIYGNKTVEAVKYFQRRNRLTVDGVVGSKTASAMGISLSGSGSSATSADLNLLARLVYAEARGEPYIGQVAVGAVVLNRIKSSSFPNTMAGVIYQPWAFTCVNDGQINLTPNDTAFKAAQDALNGWDPTYGCLYYYNPSTATSKWIWSKTVTLTIGSHSFCL